MSRNAPDPRFCLEIALKQNKSMNRTVKNKAKVNPSWCYLPFLFSYQIFTSRSLLPDVANSVPSGLNDMWCTGVAVWHFQTHSHSGSSSLFGVFGSPRSLPPPISNVTATIQNRNKPIDTNETYVYIYIYELCVVSLTCWIFFLVGISFMPHLNGNTSSKQSGAFQVPWQRTDVWISLEWTSLNPTEIQKIVTFRLDWECRILFAFTGIQGHGPAMTGCGSMALAQKCTLCPHKRPLFYRYLYYSLTLISECNCEWRPGWFGLVRMYSLKWLCCSRLHMPVNCPKIVALFNRKNQHVCSTSQSTMLRRNFFLLIENECLLWKCLWSQKRIASLCWAQRATY